MYDPERTLRTFDEILEPPVTVKVILPPVKFSKEEDAPYMVQDCEPLESNARSKLP